MRRQFILLSQNERFRRSVIFILVACACFLTFYSYTILKTGALFTHFFYIPIILACIWWKRKGLLVSVFLIGVLLVSHRLITHYTPTPADHFRMAMLICVSLIIVILREQLEHTQAALLAAEQKYRAVFDNTGTAMVIIEEDGALSMANAEFEKLSGFSLEEVIHKKNSPSLSRMKTRR